jgi:hypothetical protein
LKGIPQGRYTRKFREEAVKLVTEEKISLPEAACLADDGIRYENWPISNLKAIGF